VPVTDSLNRAKQVVLDACLRVEIMRKAIYRQARSGADTQSLQNDLNGRCRFPVPFG
jgi:hypothetical protein